MEKKFGLKAINNEAQMLKRLTEVEINFYNRLESKRLIKKQGKVPFTEHMTLTCPVALSVPSNLAVRNDIKKEIAFYNTTRANVMQGMKFLI